MRGKKRQTIDLGAFQYRRTSILQPEEESVKNNQPQVLPTDQSHTSNDKIENDLIPSSPVEKKATSPQKMIEKKLGPKKRKTRHFHRHIDTNLPQEQRLSLLVQMILQDHFEKDMTTKPEDERKQFQQAQEKLSEHLQTWANDVSSSSNALAKQTRSNPKNEELLKTKQQLKALSNVYEEELGAWDIAKEEAKNENISYDDSEIEQKFDAPKEFLSLEQLTKSAKDAVELHILQADHMQTELKRVEARNQEIHSKVQAVAAALNNRILHEFGKKSIKSTVTPFKSLEVGIVSQGKKN